MINFILLVNGQGVVRTARYYKPVSDQDKQQLETTVIKTCLSRCNQQSCILDLEDYCLVYKKFGTVILIAGVTTDENEIAVIELFQLFLETLNKLLGKITEVHLLYNLDKVYMVLDEMIINGRIAETSPNRMLATIQLMTTANQLLYNLDKVYMVLDEMIINGPIAETSPNRMLATIQHNDHGQVDS